VRRSKTIIHWNKVLTRDDQMHKHLSRAIPCSCGCGQHLFQPELHHGILSKAMFRGVKDRKLLDAPCNCFLVNKACHERIPGPEWFWQLACERYGTDAVEQWYARCRVAFKSELPNYGG